MQFNSLFQPNKLDSQLPCQHCGRRTEQDLRTDLQPWDLNSRYLVLRINHWYGNVEAERIEAETEINGFLSTGATIFGQRFHACSAITHTGTEREGHNCCWRKIAGKWLLISDNQTKKTLNRFVAGFRSKSGTEFGYDFVYMLLLDRHWTLYILYIIVFVHLYVPVLFLHILIRCVVSLLTVYDY